MTPALAQFQSASPGWPRPANRGPATLSAFHSEQDFGRRKCAGGRPARRLEIPAAARFDRRPLWFARKLSSPEGDGQSEPDHGGRQAHRHQCIADLFSHGSPPSLRASAPALTGKCETSLAPGSITPARRVSARSLWSSPADETEIALAQTLNPQKKASALGGAAMTRGQASISCSSTALARL